MDGSATHDSGSSSTGDRARLSTRTHRVGITELFGKVRGYQLQYLDGEHWKPFYHGRGTIDNLIVHLANPITARRVRLVITDTNGQLPTIVAFDLFDE